MRFDFDTAPQDCSDAYLKDLMAYLQAYRTRTMGRMFFAVYQLFDACKGHILEAMLRGMAVPPTIYTPASFVGPWLGRCAMTARIVPTDFENEWRFFNERKKENKHG